VELGEGPRLEVRTIDRLRARMLRVPHGWEECARFVVSRRNVYAARRGMLCAPRNADSELRKSTQPVLGHLA